MRRSANSCTGVDARCRRFLYLNSCLFFAFALGGCEEDIPPPPEKPTTRPAGPSTSELDILHTLQFRADRSIAFPNMVLVVQHDPIGERLGLSLTSTRGADDGSTVIVAEFTTIANVDGLAGAKIRLMGSRMFTPVGSMVRTPHAVYKPHDATLDISSVIGGEVMGTIKGTFYKFSKPLTPDARPTDVKIDADFMARLVVR